MWLEPVPKLEQMERVVCCECVTTSKCAVKHAPFFATEEGREHHVLASRVLHNELQRRVCMVTTQTVHTHAPPQL